MPKGTYAKTTDLGAVPDPPPIPKRTICLFTPHGHTFTFRDAEIVHNNETMLKFTYLSMTDGTIKHHTAIKANIVGWSIS